MKIRLSRVIIIVLAILVILAGTLLINYGSRKSIIIDLDGKLERLETRSLTVSEAVKAAGIQVTERDNIVPEKNRLLKNGDTIIVDRARRIYILADNDVHTIVTNEKQITNILAQANLSINSGDKIYINAKEGMLPSKLPPGIDTITIQIQRAVPITISTSGEGQQIYHTTASTLLEAIWDSGIQVETSDKLSIPADTPVTSNLEVEISNGQPITIKTQSDSIVIKSSASTVGEALAQAGLALQGLDYSIPNPDKPIPKNHEIQLVRLQENIIIEHTPLQFETEYQPVDDLDIDVRETIEPGEYGLIAQRVRVRIMDGIEVSRNVDDEWIAKDPKSRIVGYGTKIVKKIADTPDGPIEYWRALRMYAVSYRPKETDNTTASGLPLKKGVAAIDRRYIPFYTRMYIPGYGEAIAADVGGGVKGRMIDLGFTNEDYESWHQWVTVYFLWPPPDNIVWFIP